VSFSDDVAVQVGFENTGAASWAATFIEELMFVGILVKYPVSS